MRNILLGGLLALLLPGLAAAQCYQQRFTQRYYQPQTYQQYQQHQNRQAIILDLQNFGLGSYGASYGTDSVYKELYSMQKEIYRLKLQQLQQQPPVMVLPLPKAPPVTNAEPPPAVYPPPGGNVQPDAHNPRFALAIQRCAGCHDNEPVGDGKLLCDVKGGGIQLFDHKAPRQDLDDQALDAIEAALDSGKMPKKGAKLQFWEKCQIRAAFPQRKAPQGASLNLKRYDHEVCAWGPRRARPAGPAGLRWQPERPASASAKPESRPLPAAAAEQRAAAAAAKPAPAVPAVAAAKPPTAAAAAGPKLPKPEPAGDPHHPAATAAAPRPAASARPAAA